MPRAQEVCSEVVFQLAGPAVGPGSVCSGPGSTYSGGSSYGDPHPRSYTSNGSGGDEEGKKEQNRKGNLDKTTSTLLFRSWSSKRSKNRKCT